MPLWAALLIGLSPPALVVVGFLMRIANTTGRIEQKQSDHGHRLDMLEDLYPRVMGYWPRPARSQRRR